MSFWSHHSGQSIGRIMHFIYEYCGLRYAEEATFGNADGNIYYNGKPFAKVTEWIGPNKDIPVLYFFRSEDNFWDAKFFTKNQEQLKLYPERWIYLVSGKLVKFMPISDYGTTFSLKDFKDFLVNGCITSDDGSAMPACEVIVNERGKREFQMMNEYIDLEKIDELYPIFTHIVWFDK